MKKLSGAALAALLLLAGAAMATAQIDTAFPDGPNGYLGQPKPGDTPVLFAPGIVAGTGRKIVTMSFSPDGQLCLFNIGAWPASVAMFTEFKDGNWTVPVKAWFSETRPVDEPIFSPDGQRIYFSSSEARNSLGKADIWYLERTANAWSDLVNLGPNVNTGGDEFHPCVVGDGSIYFTDQLGNVALCRFVNGQWVSRVVLPAPINVSPGFGSWGDPYVTPDESMMLIKSKRAGSLGAHDAYVSLRNADGTWGEPRNLGPALNTYTNETSPDLSPDGKYLFMHRAGDMYWVKADFLQKPR